MDSDRRFKQSLLRMLQTGAFQRIMGYPNGRCGKIEFRLQRIYHVHLTPRYLVFHERDLEIIRRCTNGRWRSLRPIVTYGERIIIERASGRVIQATPSQGASHATPTT